VTELRFREQFASWIMATTGGRGRAVVLYASFALVALCAAGVLAHHRAWVGGTLCAVVGGLGLIAARVIWAHAPRADEEMTARRRVRRRAGRRAGGRRSH
jgi:hypothetical protein